MLCCAVLCPQIHWFSIFNSFMMVMFLTGLVAIILMRTLRRDFARCDKVLTKFILSTFSTVYQVCCMTWTLFALCFQATCSCAALHT